MAASNFKIWQIVAVALNQVNTVAYVRIIMIAVRTGIVDVLNFVFFLE